jgi:hypothetical protein
LGARLPGDLDIHVFADAGTATELTGLVDSGQGWQHLHNPRHALPAWESRSSRTPDDERRVRLRSSAVPPGQVWADWIADGLGGRAARALHVVLDAGWDGDRPVLAVTPDPNDPVDADTRTTVTADQLSGLTDLSAATLSIASPPANPADAATRMITDTLGRTRRGPTLYSSIGHDISTDALARAYTALLRPGAGVPEHMSLFAYLQPEHVLGAGYPVPDDSVTSHGESSPAPSGALSGYYAAAEEVPLWAASSQRFVEAGMTALTTAGDVSGGGFDVKRAYDRGAAGALAEIQALMARHLGEA